ncbi:hypothetical protein QQ045_019751 [Rhodiola kirilowii]
MRELMVRRTSQHETVEQLSQGVSRSLMSDHHSKKGTKTLFSFYKKDVDNQGPTSETPMPCNDSPNSLPINEMEIPPETETGNTPIIVDAPKESPNSPVQADPGLRQLICTFSVNEQDRIRREYLLIGPHQPKLNNYPQTFDGQHYKHQVVFDKDFQKLSSLAQLCRRLVEAELAKLFPLVDRLIRLVLTLPVSTATTERAFSAMKIIKTRLRNKMEDGYLSGCMMLHIEKEYVDDIDSETVIDHFESIGDRRAQFK